MKIDMTVELGAAYAAESSLRQRAPISGGFPGSALPIGTLGGRVRVDRGAAQTLTFVPPDPVAT